MIQHVAETNPVALAVVAVAFYVAKGLLAEPIARLSRRLADWLLPEELPSTYRFGKLLLTVSAKLAPAFSVRAPDGHLVARGVNLRQGTQYFPIPVLRRSSVDWSDLESAEAELEVDEAAEAPVIAPVQLVLPLLFRAAVYRLLNGFARLEYVSWWLFVGVPYMFALGASYVSIDMFRAIHKRV